MKPQKSISVAVLLALALFTISQFVESYEINQTEGWWRDTFNDTTGITSLSNVTVRNGDIKLYPNFYLEYSDWTKRKNIKIENTGVEDLTNYQVNLTVNWTEGMNSTFNDLRFTYYNSSSKTEQNISYWLENYTSQRARVWVRVPEIPVSGNVTIYMYYGNPSANSASNGDATFEFFDDFEGTSLDGNKWNTYSYPHCGKGGINLNNSILNLSCAQIISKNYSIGNGIIESETRSNPKENSFLFRAQGSSGDQFGSNSYGLYNSNGSIGDKYNFGITKNGAEPPTSGLAASDGVWYTVRIVLNGSNIYAYRYNLDASLHTQISRSDLITYSDGHIGLRVNAALIGDTIGEYKWIRARKYTYPEPMVSIGNEEDRIYKREGDLTSMTTINETTLYQIKKSGNNYEIEDKSYWKNTSEKCIECSYNCSCANSWHEITSKIIDKSFNGTLQGEIYQYFGSCGIEPQGTHLGYTINSNKGSDVIEIGSTCSYETYVSVSKYAGDLSDGDIVRFWMMPDGYFCNGRGCNRNNEILEYRRDGNVFTSILSSESLLSWKHLRFNTTKGTLNTHPAPVQVDIYGNSDGYTSPINSERINLTKNEINLTAIEGINNNIGLKAKIYLNRNPGEDSPIIHPLGSNPTYYAKATYTTSKVSAYITSIEIKPEVLASWGRFHANATTAKPKEYDGTEVNTTHLYHFNGDSNDSVGSSHWIDNSKNGYGTGVNATFGSAMRLDGSNQITMDELPIETPQGTIEMWFKADDVSRSKNGLEALFDSENHYPYGRTRLYFSSIPGRDLVYVINDTAQIVNSTLLNNTWYHVAITWDGTNMKLYLNGELKDTTPNTGHPVDGQYKAALGSWNSYYGYDLDFNGYIDEFRISNVARTRFPQTYTADITYKILDASDNSTLYRITSEQANAGYPINRVAFGVNSTRLYAELNTTNNLTTPVLHDWNISWSRTDYSWKDSFDDNETIAISSNINVSDGDVSILRLKHDVLSNWTKRSKLMISNKAENLTNYPVKVILNSSNFNFSSANPDGNDTRFTWFNSTSWNETEIPYWIESWNSTSKNATIRVNV